MLYIIIFHHQCHAIFLSLYFSKRNLSFYKNSITEYKLIIREKIVCNIFSKHSSCKLFSLWMSQKVEWFSSFFFNFSNVERFLFAHFLFEIQIIWNVRPIKRGLIGAHGNGQCWNNIICMEIYIYIYICPQFKSVVRNIMWKRIMFLFLLPIYNLRHIFVIEANHNTIKKLVKK